ncbi:hypothetical protein NDU88_009364, partial [Pleurodeles waltl]
TFISRKTKQPELLSAEIRMIYFCSTMDFRSQFRTLAFRRQSLGNTCFTKSQRMPTLSGENDAEKIRFVKRRRATLASYIPCSVAENASKEISCVGAQKGKALKDMKTEDVCQWFADLGLDKCIPFIK